MINMEMNKEISIQALQKVKNSSLDEAIWEYFVLMEAQGPIAPVKAKPKPKIKPKTKEEKLLA